MRVTLHSPETKRWSACTGVLVALGLSAGLLAPPNYAGPIVAVVASVMGIGVSAIKENMLVRTANFSLVSVAERDRFLLHHTIWVFLMLLAYGAVVALIFTRLDFPVRAGLGHAALLVGSFSAVMGQRTEEAHLNRVVPTGDRQSGR